MTLGKRLNVARVFCLLIMVYSISKRWCIDILINKLKKLFKRIKIFLQIFILFLAFAFMVIGLFGTNQDNASISLGGKIFFISIAILLTLPIILLYIRRSSLKDRNNISPKHLYEEDLNQRSLNNASNQPVLKDIDVDEYLWDAGEYIINTRKATIGAFVRVFKIGFNRAAGIMGQLHAIGVVGAEQGTKPREILMTLNEFREIEKAYKAKVSAYEVYEVDRVDMYNDKFDYMTGSDFEIYCADILKRSGFENVKNTKHSNDQGVDIIAEKEGIKYGIQCKCYSESVGNSSIQQVVAGKNFYNCHVGVVLTNNYFTSSAIELAKPNNVLLWDRNKLIELVKKATNKEVLY